MKTEIHKQTTPTPPEEPTILDEIRNDHELVERLQITPQELQALSKCALLGSLSCKDDMLFILRQIREATGPATGLALPPPDFSECPSLDEYEDQEPVLPASPQIRARITPLVTPERSVDGSGDRGLSMRIAVLVLAVVLAAAVLWEGFIAMWRMGGGFMTTIATRLSEAPPPGAWYSALDRFSVLLTFEALLVVAIMTVICLRSLRGFTRLKVKPSWR